MINPKYEYLREYVERIPKDFETIGTVIHSGRNLIKMITVDGLDINVKRYTIPPLINRIAYAFFRPSKGKRAFVYPEKLLEKGFETPCPIAYIEETKMGLIGHSYFMSIQSPARLHEAGILHLDYSPGNILYDKIGEEYHFSLVDINRMHFGEVDIKKGCANFARLWGQTPFFILLGKEYARSRGMDEEECVRLVLHYRKKFWNRYRRRHQVWFQLDI